MKTFPKHEFEALNDGLIEAYPRLVVHPQRRGGKCAFDEFGSPTQFELEHDQTVRGTGKVTCLVRSNGGKP